MIFFNKISNSETNFDSKVDNKSAMMLLGIKSDDNHDRSLSSNTETQILKETRLPKAIALATESKFNRNLQENLQKCDVPVSMFIAHFRQTLPIQHVKAHKGDFG